MSGDAPHADRGAAPHVIRLRGPWQAEADGAELRVKLPCTWGDALPADSGRATLSRRFNQPTGLAAGDQVLLRLATPHGLAAARLNGAEITLESGVANLTPRLEPSNELSLTLEGAGPDAVLLDAQLEIHAAS
ncbi:hypothetical protein Pla123a_40880 [Posidoniimonas polymericola]|uniref:Uncharacterized protein n=1 Tax=Posidoniimonas polymericola TaxID=2528002 RepID=A0A5C5YCX0_9BACT|nr:hypothetical protein [Posidoniimonas polymericola]TWT72789.1 hypothetical protein Pla123a_40880 [Posidoniimonas polymericola]